MYKNNIEFLREYTNISKGKAKHEYSKYARFFPFTANDSRATFQHGVERMIGEVVRQISSVELSKANNHDELLCDLMDKIDFEDESVKSNFKDIYKNYIGANESSVRIVHPYMYNFISLSENESLREKGIAEFIKNVLFENVDVVKFFDKASKSNIFVDLLLKSMGDLTHKDYDEQYSAIDEIEFNKTSKQKAFKSKLSFITKNFQNDFIYLGNNSEIFMKYLPLFISYYYFMYICQLSIKLDQGFKADFSAMSPLYWILDLESLSKSREANKNGYKQVMEANRNLMSNVVQLAHINILTGEDRSRTLVEISSDLDANELDDLSKDIYEWTVDYVISFDSVDETLKPGDFKSSARQLLQKIREHLPSAPARKFPKPIDTIGKRYFLKSRGLYGNTLNLTQDLLLLLVGLSVKDERKLLKEVFSQLEDRGVYLDRFSQDEVVLLLDKLNLLDKKSDSGDAQYVKPIF